MPQSLAQIYVHLIFSTRGRVPFLRDQRLRGELHAYLAETLHRLDSPSLRTGGVEDHIHSLFRLGRIQSVAEIVREVKRVSSKWLKEKTPNLRDFHWQSGYAAFSISPTHLEKLQEYIVSQEEHHKSESFQDEVRRICGFYGVGLDERYAWD